jgi:hypothetical protein
MKNRAEIKTDVGAVTLQSESMLQQYGSYCVPYTLRTLLKTEPRQLSRYSDWLRAGRRRGRSSSPGRVKNF